MTRIGNFILLILLLPLLNSCITKTGTLKHPCFGEEFLQDIHHLTKDELAKLARLLEASSYPNSEKSGCRAALLGQVYFAQERTSLASEYFSQAAQKLPELSDYFLLAKARVELKRRDFDQAQRIAHALLDSHTSALSPSFSLRVRRVLADVAAHKKDDVQIIKTHQELLDHGFKENEALLFNLASSLSNIGEHKRADEVYKRLLINFPTSREAEQTVQVKSLSDYHLELKQTEKRFDKLIEKLAFNQAVDDADNLIKNLADDVDSRAVIEGLAIKSLVLNNQFNAAMKRGEKRYRAKNATAREIESHAWTLGKLGRFVDASEAYERLMSLAKDKNAKAKACFFKGFSLYEGNLYSMALFSWHGCRDIVQGSDKFEDYLWYQALSSILSENFAMAVLHFRDLKTHFPKSKDDEKYTYFLAYTLQQMNKARDADAILRELGKKTQPSYYVLLARKATGQAEITSQPIAPDALSRLAKPEDESSSRNALILYHLGFRDEARDLVLTSNASSSDKLAMLQHLGFYHDVWQRSHLLKPRVALSDNKVEITPTIRSSYPMPYRTLIDRASRKYEVNRNLLYAIMQAESGFFESAVSFRGAIGLMQMMPFVAEDLASRVSLEQFNSEQLKDPRVAIELGALFLATLQRQFSNPHLVVAAYNAGPHQVQKWLSLFGHLPKELFIERIPFKQTRDYVKIVLPNESLYHAMSEKTLRLAL